MMLRAMLFVAQHWYQLLQGLAGNHLVLKNNFKAVIGSWIVAGSDHNAIAAAVAVMDGKIQRWCGDFPKVNNVAATGN